MDEEVFHGSPDPIGTLLQKLSESTNIVTAQQNS